MFFNPHIFITIVIKNIRIKKFDFQYIKLNRKSSSSIMRRMLYTISFEADEKEILIESN